MHDLPHGQRLRKVWRIACTTCGIHQYCRDIYICTSCSFERITQSASSFHSPSHLLHVTIMLLDPSNDTIPVGWYDEPSYRGTFSLLWSCISTLVLCVLSAVHLDVPPVDQTWIHKYANRIKWVAVGIFAPEWLSLIAWVEWRNASAVVNVVKGHRVAVSMLPKH